MTILIVGLGNPGSQYHKTRHNVGFMVLDAIAEHCSIAFSNNKFHGLFGQGICSGHKILLLKPQTFMNLSGKSVLECAHFYKILPDKIIVIHDDLDLELARVKVKQGGSHAGHNGLKSIDSMISPNYVRLRFGISRPQHGNISDYVLKDFLASEQPQVSNAIADIIKNIKFLLDGDFQNFMNNYAIDQKSKTGAN